MKDLPEMSVKEHHALAIGILACCHEHVPSGLKRAIVQHLETAKAMGMKIKPGNLQAGSETMLSTRQTVFYIEGQRTALLMTRAKRGYRERVLKIESAEVALAWCKQHAAGLVYCPPDAQMN
jgi:hypothetical protein